MNYEGTNHKLYAVYGILAANLFLLNGIFLMVLSTVSLLLDTHLNVVNHCLDVFSLIARTDFKR